MSRCWDQQRFEFETYGFALFDSVLDVQTPRRLARRLDLLDEQRGIDYTHDGAFARHISSVYADDDDLMALIDHLDVLGFIESALGSEIISGAVTRGSFDLATRFSRSTAIFRANYGVAERP